MRNQAVAEHRVISHKVHRVNSDTLVWSLGHLQTKQETESTTIKVEKHQVLDTFQNSEGRGGKVHESTKRPSKSNGLKLTTNICSGSGRPPPNVTVKTPITWFRRAHELSEQEVFACLTSADPWDESEGPEHMGAASETQHLVRRCMRSCQITNSSEWHIHNHGALKKTLKEQPRCASPGRDNNSRWQLQGKRSDYHAVPRPKKREQ